MTFKELAKIVADDFQATMTEFDFETFDEMKECYWWTSKDIKDEVDAIIRLRTENRAYIDELDGSDVFIDFEGQAQEMMSYKKFATMWRKMLKEVQA